MTFKDYIFFYKIKLGIVGTKMCMDFLHQTKTGSKQFVTKKEGSWHPVFNDQLHTVVMVRKMEMIIYLFPN